MLSPVMTIGALTVIWSDVVMCRLGTDGTGENEAHDVSRDRRTRDVVRMMELGTGAAWEVLLIALLVGLVDWVVFGLVGFVRTRIANADDGCQLSTPRRQASGVLQL